MDRIDGKVPQATILQGMRRRRSGTWRFHARRPTLRTGSLVRGRRWPALRVTSSTELLGQIILSLSNRHRSPRQKTASTDEWVNTGRVGLQGGAAVRSRKSIRRRRSPPSRKPKSLMRSPFHKSLCSVP
jgi:hypothetical protein